MGLPRRLHIPDLKTQQLANLLADTTGAARDILRLQAFAADIIKGIRSIDATPADVALLALWARAFRLADSALLAYGAGDTFVLKLLDRSAAESSLQVHTIVEPFGSGALEERKELVRERLHAYLAWTIWNDRTVDESFLQYMDVYWSNTPSERALGAGKEYELFEELGGAPEIENAHILEAEKAKQEQKLRDRIGLRDTILADPTLAPWVDKIRAREGKNRDPVSFFHLATGTPGGVRARMKVMEMPHANPSYAEASAEVHGSGIESLMFLTPQLAGPRLPRTGSDVNLESLAQAIRGTIAPQLIILQMLIRRFGGASELKAD